MVNIICIIVNIVSVLDEWRVELESFYEIRGIREVIEKFNIENVVMIIGNFGIGKIVIMRYVLFIFEERGYEVVLISLFEEIFFYRFFE